MLDGEPVDAAALDAGTRRRVGAALARSGVELVSLDTSVELTQPFERDLRSAIELASDWGTTTVRVFGGTADAEVDDIARRLEPLLDLGITVALETHDGFARADRVVTLLDRLPQLAAIWDVHHPHAAGESVGDVLGALGSRIRIVHVKDAVRVGAGWQLVALGTGEVPARESVDALRDAGYAGWLAVEWEKRWHPELDEPEIALPRELATLRRWL